MEYISGKAAQLILSITTRQGLHKVVKANNISYKSQGAGKPNLYLKSDVVKAAKVSNEPRHKYNPEIKKKVNQKKKIVNKNITVFETTKQKAKVDLDQEDFNPLNKIGESEFLRVEQLLIKNGTYANVDRSLLLIYAISYQKYINAVTQSAANDDVTMNDMGDLKIHPYFQVADKCFSHMQKLSTMLGIGVRSRVGLEIAKEKKKSFFDMPDENFNA